MRTGRLAIDQPPSLDRGLLRVRRPFDHDALLNRPARCLFARLLPEHVRVDRLQYCVGFQFLFDLDQELGRIRTGVAEYPHRDFRVVQDFLNHPGVGDDRALVVLARPQVQVPVWTGLDLPAASVQPWVPGILPVQQLRRREYAVVPSEPSYRLNGAMAASYQFLGDRQPRLLQGLPFVTERHGLQQQARLNRQQAG